MNLFRLALLNIKGSAFRSVVVTLCAVLVASFTLATTLLLRGNQASMQIALGRLGADIVVVPMGSRSQADTTLLTGITTRVWMPESNVSKLAALDGVLAASPQLYLTTLTNDPCCSVPSIVLMAYDPATDFTVSPWLEKNVGHELGLGEVVGGADIVIPKGQEFINLFGYSLTLKSNLKVTGSGWDQTMFITFDTAREISRLSKTLLIIPLDYPAAKVSSVFIKLAPGYDPQIVALNIIKSVPGVTPIKSSELFQVYRQQMSGILDGLLAILGITWILSLFIIGLVFTLAAHERRRELGVLRAIGANRGFIVRSLISEAGILALVGALAGAILAVVGIVVFRQPLITALGLPFIFPTLPVLLAQIAIGLLVTLFSVALAAFIPAYRISHQDPAVAMRE
ncbi:MAG: ABC transporter permease [Anaerolineae bacterium]